jgi:hypothetical protein
LAAAQIHFERRENICRTTPTFQNLYQCVDKQVSETCSTDARLVPN